MRLEFDEIKAYLHYYAGRFQSKYFQHDELVNEAWMIVHKLEHIEWASAGIRWAMLLYINKQRALNHKGSTKAVIFSIEKETGLYNKLIKDIIEDPKNFNQSIDDKDLVKSILDRAHLSMSERILIDQIYFRGWNCVKIAKLGDRTHQAVRRRLNKVLDRITKIAMREVA